MKETRITLIIYALGCGGAERVLSMMANYWAERGSRVTLITLAGPEEKPFFKLAPEVCWSPLGIAQNSKGFFSAMSNNVARVFALRRAITASSPDIVLSFLDTVNVLTLLACFGLRVPVVISERTNPAARNIGLIWNSLRRWAYPRARAVVVQTRVAQEFFPPRIQARCRIIGNPVMPPTPSVSGNVKRGNQIIGIGRLVEHKGFDLLLRAFARIAPAFPDWQLVIWGEGAERDALERLARELRIEQQVRLPGQTTDVQQSIESADLFVLPSRFEGFPNALCEAMARGVPAISFDLPGGPREIVDHEVNGLLVPFADCEALANAMSRLMNDKHERARLGQEAAKIVDRYSVARIMNNWENLFSTIGAVRQGDHQAIDLSPENRTKGTVAAQL